ncbi:MAG: ABC transporter substrate-binding protein [Alphaproteobacteria bacterium]|nr:ABC transporter substrate-binding protein [Alphaproteobacteria bacterium]
MASVRRLALVAVAVAAVAAPASAQSGGQEDLRIVTLTGYSTTPFPNASWDWGAATLMPVLFEALTEVEDGGQITPALAIRWRAENETTWIFTLRPGVTFSNGEPFDARAVQSAIAYLKSPEGRTLGLAREVENIVAVESRGGSDVAIRIHQPDALLPRKMRAIHMLPPDYFAKVGKDGFAKAPIGSGPFTATRLAVGRAEFAANPSAWRAPRVTRLTFLRVAESTARIQAILSGGADIAFNVGPGADAIVAGSGARVDAVQTAGVDAMPFITVKQSPVKDARVRLALNLAVDKARMADTILDGRTTPATQFAPQHVFGYDPTLTEPFPRDVSRARRLLDEAGYPDGFELELELYVDGAEKAAIVEQVRADLAEVGVRLKITTSTVMDIQERGIYGGRWSGQMMNLPYSGLPSFDALAAFNVHSCLWMAPFHCDQAITSRIEDARRTVDLGQRLAKTRAIIRALNDDPPALLLFDSVRFFVVGARVTGYRAPFGIIRYHEVGLLN